MNPGQTTTELFSSVTFCNAIEEQGLEDSEQTITVKSIAIQLEETGTMEEAYGSFINQEHVRKDTTETTNTKEPAPQMPENREAAVDDGGHDE